MKEEMKKIIIVALTLIMCFSGSHFITLGAENTESEPDAIPEGVILNYHELETIDTSFSNEKQDIIPVRGTLPESYSASSNIPDDIDVEEKDNYVTPVKDQNPYGTCWAHAAISIAESSAIKNGVTDDTIDYNEYHLVNYVYGEAEDALNLFGGDYNANGSENISILQQGGNNIISMGVFANWIGVSDASEDTFGSTHIENGVVPEEFFAYDDAAHLENGYVLYMPDMSTDNYQTDMNIVKQMIMDYGSVAMSYYAASEEAFYKTGYQYVDTYMDTNHGVTIVGWDDTIPAESFATTAPGDGAWLVKNSWGTYWGLDGYFWLSYYDATIGSNAIVFDFGSSDNYDNNYQYDGTGFFYGSTTGYMGQVCGANAFVADSDETIVAIGIYTHDINTEYEIQIYRGLEEGALPNTGTLVATQNGMETYVGYHTIELKQDVPIEKGERYAVVVTLKGEDNQGMFFPADMSTSYGWIEFYSFAKKGESYSGYDVDNLFDLNSENTTYANGVNVRIKAFTNERDFEILVNKITLDKTSINIKRGDSAKISAIVAPLNASNINLKWSSSDSQIASVDQNGNITAKKVGKAVITVAATDGSGVKATCTVTVEPIKVKNITIASGTQEITDTLTVIDIDQLQLSAYVTPTNADNTKVKWTSSNKNVATIDQSGLVTVVGIGETKITASAQDGSGVSRTITFVVQPVYTESLDIIESQITLYKGSVKQLNVELLPTNASYQTFDWRTSNASVAEVDEYGNVTAKSSGETVIYAYAKDGSGYYDYCKVRVVIGPGNNDYSVIFDSEYYANKYKDVRSAYGYDASKLAEHFINHGIYEGRQGNASFNVYSYRNLYTDLRLLYGTDLSKYYGHYMEHGFAEGRIGIGYEDIIVEGVTVCDGIDYSAVYNFHDYIKYNPDVYDSYGNNDVAILRHFVEFGMPEGRQGIESFNVNSYKNLYSDLRQVYGYDLKKYYQHYMNCGQKEGRIATGYETTLVDAITVYNGVDYSAIYDYNYYVSQNQDVFNVYGYNDEAVLAHFVNFGMAECRASKETFDVRSYHARYEDLQKAFGQDWKSCSMHYVLYGYNEGRNAIPSCYDAIFDAAYYLKKNSGIQSVFGTNPGVVFEHFLNYGMAEGRQACAEFKVSAYKSRYSDLRKAFGDELKAYYMHYMNFGKAEGRSGK